MNEKFSAQCRMMIHAACDEAKEAGSPWGESKHLLLALFREKNPFVAPLLRHRDVDVSFEAVKNRIADKPPRPAEPCNSPDVTISYAFQRILAYAAEEAAQLGHPRILTGHLILGVLREEECLASEIMREMGFRLSIGRLVLFEMCAAALASALVQLELSPGTQLRYYPGDSGEY